MEFLRKQSDNISQDIKNLLLKAYNTLDEYNLSSNLIKKKDYLLLKEAKDSCEIENIFTSFTDLYKKKNYLYNKEIWNYHKALLYGTEQIKTGRLTNNIIIEIQNYMKKNSGFRKLPGTVIASENKIIYTPPSPEKIIPLMSDLEKLININSFDDFKDPLITMALIHHSFESIHPFYDGNGRTGRIINVLYLKLRGVLKYPVFNLSAPILKTKQRYYQLLQKGSWEEWVSYMLNMIIEACKEL